MAPKIPDRWIPYKACGNVIEGTRFICFKVPLKKSVQMGNREIKDIWDIPTLLNKIPNLGAVIDLTNTARYYDPRELQAARVIHKKLLMPGRVIPPEDKVKEFMDTVDELLGKDCEMVLGVHCTHGLNRTGYMVCRYMRDRLGIPAKDAIKKFEKARGYQIERENYIADLLGKTPPPPDIGCPTVVKPIDDRRNDMTYRSPLGYDDYEECNDRRNSYGRRYGYNNDNRVSRRGTGQSHSYTPSSRGSRGEGSSNSHSSYNYKYDY